MFGIQAPNVLPIQIPEYRACSVFRSPLWSKRFPIWENAALPSEITFVLVILVAQEMYDNENESDWPVIDPTSLEVQMEDSIAVIDIDAPSSQQDKIWNYFEKQV